MIIYGKTLELFRKRIKRKIKQILLEECYSLNIKVLKKRFQLGKYYYPLEVIAFEKNNLLGYFDPSYYTIGIHKNLVLLDQHDPTKKTLFENIIRHELAHYLCFILYGRQIDDHGMEYRKLCQSFGWNEEVYSAKLKVDQDLLSQDVKRNSAILEKVKKLLSLASSQNENESQIATLKANELLQKHQLQISELDSNSDNMNELSDHEEEMVCQTVWTGKRNNTKMLCISEILGEFLVFPYFNYGSKEVRLEIMGKRENVEIADYLCKYYQNEFENLWKKQKDLKGMRQKNSFFRGLCQGHILKLKNAKTHEAEASALILAKNELVNLVRLYLPQVSAKAHDYKTDHRAQSLGKQSGQSMQIRKGINEGLKKIKQINFFG